MEKTNLNRRELLRKTGACVAGLKLASITSIVTAGEDEHKTPGLFDRIYGCIAGAYIGSAMGVPVEGWDAGKIGTRYGLLQELLPRSFSKGTFPPGATEDGMERQKYMYLAIIEKQDRITADDLVGTWLKVMDNEKLEGMNYMTEQFDRDLMGIARTGTVPARRLGEKGYAHLNAPIRCFHPIALINACDEDGAIKDMQDVLRVYQPMESNGYEWGAAYMAAVAHALRPDASVDSVIETALKYSSADMKKEIQAGLEIVAKISDPINERKAIYKGFAKIYNKQSDTGAYPQSRAHECATVALSFFKAAKGNVKDGIILAANNGRDTDCNTAATGGLCGAFSGTKTVPAEWIETVDAATKKNPYTNSQLTIEETAKGMHAALQNKVRKMEAYGKLIRS
ncbi:MAG: ADP-ribosylglycohydrolase family protein [Planctomycetota bacterium]